MQSADVSPAQRMMPFTDRARQRRFSSRGVVLALAACLSVAAAVAASPKGLGALVRGAGLRIAGQDSRFRVESALPETHGFVIVIATFDSAARGSSVAASLVKKNVPAFVAQTPGHGRFQVVAGPYVSSDEAAGVLATVVRDFAEARLSRSDQMRD